MPLQLGVNFASKSEEKQKQSLSVAIFSQPNSNEGQNNKKKKEKRLYSSVCDFYSLNYNEDQSKKILFDDFLYDVSWCDIYFILRII